MPTEWKEGYIIKLPKKGDLSKCDNYRGIPLLSIPGKVFNRIILNRMKDQVDTELRDQQTGFRKDRSCTDQIATLRIIVEQSLEWNSSLYITFVDYKKAFDNLDRSALWNLLRHYGVPAKIVNIIRNSYDCMTSMKPWREAYGDLRSENQGSSGMPALALSLLASHRLDNEDYNSTYKNRNPMDNLHTTRRPGFCG